MVLYRNGIGYFERRGEVKGDALVIKVRKDQVNDLLKSLTVIEPQERPGGQRVDAARPRVVGQCCPFDPGPGAR